MTGNLPRLSLWFGRFSFAPAGTSSAAVRRGAAIHPVHDGSQCKQGMATIGSGCEP